MTAVVNKPRYCSRLVLETFPRHTLPYSFALQKNSSFTPFFSKHIFDLKERGRIIPLRNKWYYQSEHCAGTDAQAQRFDWKYAFSLVVLLLVTTVFCCVTLLGEHLITRWRRSSGGNKVDVK